MGGYTATDECRNNKCECATQGRSQICDTGSSTHSSSFGTHAINCTYHPYGDVSLHQTEQKIDGELSWKTYNQHMDSHLGLWTNDLSGYIDKLEEDSHQMLKMSWPGNSRYRDSTFYSVMAEACPGYFVEFISDSTHGLTKSDFKFVDEPRLDFNKWKVPSTSSDTVVKVSRATTKIDEMLDFYVDAIGGETLSQTTTDDGVKWAIVKLDHADAQLHFVNRPAPKDATFTVEDLETYVNKVHKTYIKSTNCGFD